jgi:hypothetical protein
MSLIIFRSDAKAPGNLQPPLPRYEIGKLIGKQRDDGYTDTEIEMIKSKLDAVKW